MKKIAILTGTRAEYGLLRGLISKFQRIDGFDVRIVVTGSHLSPEFGYTYKEIEADGFQIDEKIEILLSSDSSSSVSKAMGLALISFSDYFSRLNPDMVIVLGDRFEALAVSIAAANEKIPIAHIHGGEVTEGAIDDCMRHCITKLSYLHFTSTEVYRKRVIQLGENPNRVFNVGALGVENIHNFELLTLEELEKSLKTELQFRYGLVTFHPTTLSLVDAKSEITEVLKACSKLGDVKLIFTKANADSSGRLINQMIDEYVATHVNALVYDSIGVLRYLSAIKYASFVMGNSSSGIIEVPSFKVPTINIGDRQKGRIKSNSVIDCEVNFESILRAVNLATSLEFKEKLREMDNPYYKENTSDNIVKIITEMITSETIEAQKKFFDLEG